MGDNILINGVQVDLNPPGTESVTRVSLNRRVDDMVQVARALHAVCCLSIHAAARRAFLGLNA